MGYLRPSTKRIFLELPKPHLAPWKEMLVPEDALRTLAGGSRSCSRLGLIPKAALGKVGVRPCSLWLREEKQTSLLLQTTSARCCLKQIRPQSDVIAGGISGNASELPRV